MKNSRFALISGAALSLALAGCSQYATVSEKCPSRLPSPAGSGALLTLAEQTIAKALRKDDDKPLAAIGEYLDAAEIASRQLKSFPNDAIARRDYNFAISRVFSTLRAEKIPAWGGEPLRVTGANGEWQLSGRTDITRDPSPA